MKLKSLLERKRKIKIINKTNVLSFFAVGKPIDLPEIIEPSTEVIDKYHQLYINGLYEIFNAHKEKFASDPQMQLIIK